MVNLFISYRRSDSSDFVGRLYDKLIDSFNIFLDKEKIGYGEEFNEVIKQNIKESDVFLLIVGKDFCKELKAKGNSVDYLVQEVLYAKELDKKIIPILQDGVDMPNCLEKDLAFVTKLNAFMFGRGRFDIYISELKKSIKNSIDIKNQFIKEVLETSKRERMVVLFSQDFTRIDRYKDELKKALKVTYQNNFYDITVPYELEDEEEYFSCIANECKLNCTTKRAYDWYKEMRELLKSTKEDVFLFISNIENGNEKLDKKFAKVLRDLKSDFRHFYVILIGRKDLAKLVYKDGNLSPLNSARELFFPDDNLEIDESKVAQQFVRLAKHRDIICKYLPKDSLGRFTTWHFSEVINELFWKNLIKRDGNYFVWREESIKQIASEVLEYENS